MRQASITARADVPVVLRVPAAIALHAIATLAVNGVISCIFGSGHRVAVLSADMLPVTRPFPGRSGVECV